MLPGVFVSVANFTPELLPPELLYKVASAELATPLPLFMEALFVNFLLEIVREAGLRLPKPIGHSVSLVAALIVGDAAVSAGIVGTPVVIVAAMTAICTFVVPSLYEPTQCCASCIYWPAASWGLWVSLRCCFVCCWGCAV